MTRRLTCALAAVVVTALLAPRAALAQAAPATQPAAPAAAAAPAATAAARADDDGPPRFSLPTESDRAVWRKPGFRLTLGIAYGGFIGLNGAPSARVIAPVVRFGVRLDRAWSLQASLQYWYASAGGLSGWRYSGTIEPVWHVTDRLSLAVGLGFGGIVETTARRPDPNPQPDTLDTSYTFPSAHTPMATCSGVGATALGRGEYLVVVGPRAATGLALEIAGQWTGCVADTGRVEPDTATPIVRRQWWPHFGVSLGWVIAWR